MKLELILGWLFIFRPLIFGERCWESGDSRTTFFETVGY